MDDSIEVAIVNYRTDKLTRRAVASVRRFYPMTRIVIYDNGGSDVQWIRDMVEVDPYLRAIYSSTNRGHGGGLAECAGTSRARCMLSLDSDATIVRDGLLEILSDGIGGSVAAGRVRLIDEYGRNVGRGAARAVVRYVHPVAALWNLNAYDQIGEPFIDHGAPAIRVCYGAMRDGWDLRAVQIGGYIGHKGHGTRAITGPMGRMPAALSSREIRLAMRILKRGTNGSSKQSGAGGAAGPGLDRPVSGVFGHGDNGP